MKKKEKLKEISSKLISDRENFMSAFRANLFMYLKFKCLTLNDLSSEADISFSTLNTFLYGKGQTMLLTNAVKLARALEISIDELVGSETISTDVRDVVKMCRILPEQDVHLVQWMVHYLYDQSKICEPSRQCVSVMKPELNNHGDLEITFEFEKVDISEFDQQMRTKISMGIVLGHDYYMPRYSHTDIILIANDRPAKPNEICLIRAHKSLYLARHKEIEGDSKFFSIRDGKEWLEKTDVSEVMGYVVGVKKQ